MPHIPAGVQGGSWKQAHQNSPNNIIQMRSAAEQPIFRSGGNQVPYVLGIKGNSGNGLADILHHFTSHIVDKKEPVDPRDFAQAKQVINLIKKTRMKKV